jgi:cysteine desulfurase
MSVLSPGPVKTSVDTRIYLDNAATTPLDPEVLDAMMPYLVEKFGNPSSIYSYGRESRLAIENARKSVAKILNAKPSEIFFTSGGTEADNTAILGAVHDLGCKTIISSPIEHHATLHTVKYLEETGQARLLFVNLLPDGHIDLQHLEELLKNTEGKVLVSLMHANNEIGNMIDLQVTGGICRRYNALFHSDTVQTLGHFQFDLRNTPVDFITGSAHKFHGPKGVGLLYVNENLRISPFIHGGSQERNMRAGTENLYGIVGFAKALQLAFEEQAHNATYILGLKHYMLHQLENNIPGVSFNGDPHGSSLFTVLSVNFPKTEKTEMLLFNLDINHICASGGSACTSGAEAGSHVIQALHQDRELVTVRFSFSKLNTKQEIDQVIETLKEMVY